jgi:hypothetical protein
LTAAFASPAVIRATAQAANGTKGCNVGWCKGRHVSGGNAPNEERPKNHDHGQYSCSFLYQTLVNDQSSCNLSKGCLHLAFSGTNWLISMRT